MSLLKHYHDAVEAGTITKDPAQLEAISVLQEVWDGLMQPRPTPPKVSGLRGLFGGKRPVVIEPVRGVYLWGGVGRGKTWVGPASRAGACRCGRCRPEWRNP